MPERAFSFELAEFPIVGPGICRQNAVVMPTSVAGISVLERDPALPTPQPEKHTMTVGPTAQASA